MSEAPNERLKARRLALGLTEAEVATRAGMGLHHYCDVEQYADEFTSTLTLAEARTLCHVLKLDLDQFLPVQEDLERASSISVDLSRNALVAKRREEKRLSREELADRLGFDEGTIAAIESNADFLEGWPIDLIAELARELDLPVRSLAGQGEQA